MIDVKIADKEHIQSLFQKGEDDLAIKFIIDNYGCSFGEARDAVNDIKEQPLYVATTHKEKKRKKLLLAIVPIAVFGVYILIVVLLSYIKPEQIEQKRVGEQEYNSYTEKYVATEEDIKEFAEDLVLEAGMTEVVRNNLLEEEVGDFSEVEMYEEYHLGIINISFYYLGRRFYEGYAYAIKPISEQEYVGTCISTSTKGDLYDKLKEIIRKNKQTNN